MVAEYFNRLSYVQRVLLPRLSFLWFALHYVFNLEYEKDSKDLCLDFNFGLRGT